MPYLVSTSDALHCTSIRTPPLSSLASSPALLALNTCSFVLGYNRFDHASLDQEQLSFVAGERFVVTRSVGDWLIGRREDDEHMGLIPKSNPHKHSLGTSCPHPAPLTPSPSLSVRSFRSLLATDDEEGERWG